MNRNFSVTLVSMLFFSRFAISAPAVQNCDSKTVKDHVQIMKGTGAAARNPTLEELFDAYNSSKTVHEDLKYDETKKIGPEVYVEVKGKDPVYVDFQSVPKKGFGDPRCKVKRDEEGKVIRQTGYDCRVEQLRQDEETEGLPNGIKTGVLIKVPLNDPEAIARVSKALGCGEILEASGKPVLDGVAEKPAVRKESVTTNAKAKAQKPAAPASAPAASAAKTKAAPGSNVIPAIQLQAVPAQPASAPAATSR